MCAFLGDYTDVFTCDEGPLFYFFFVFKANMGLYPVCVQYEPESVRARMWVGRVSMGLSRSQNVEQRLPEEKRSEKTSYRSNGEHSLAPLWHEQTHTQPHTRQIAHKHTQTFASREGTPKPNLAGHIIPGSGQSDVSEALLTLTQHFKTAIVALFFVAFVHLALF